MANSNRTFLTEVEEMKIKITEPDLQVRNSFCPTWQPMVDEIGTLACTYLK